MSFIHPASKSGHLFDQIGACLLKDDAPTPFTIAQMRREAGKVIQTPNVAVGHLLMSGIAAIEWDVDEAKLQVEEAVRLDSSADMLRNALVTFSVLARPDLAAPYALALAERAPANRVAIDDASSILIALGRVGEAAEMQTACVAINPAATFEVDAMDVADRMRRADVSEEWVAEELRLAREVFIGTRTRLRQVLFSGDDDPDGTPCLAFSLGFFGSLEDEFRLEERLAERLAATERWNPARLSVHLQYLEFETEDAVVTS